MKTLFGSMLVLLLGMALSPGIPLVADDNGFNSALEKITGDVAKVIGESGRQKLIVLDFTDAGGDESVLGNHVAEQISVGLATAGKHFKIVDRATARTALNEKRLTADMVLKPDAAKRFSGIDGFVAGSLTPMNSGYYVTVKILSADKLEIDGAVRANLPRNSDIATAGNGAPLAGVKNPNGLDSAPAKAPVFRSDLLNAKVGNFQAVRDGELLVTVELSRATSKQQIALSFCDFKPDDYATPESLHDESSEAYLKAMRQMPVVLRKSTGEEYRLKDQREYLFAAIPFTGVKVTAVSQQSSRSSLRPMM